MSLHFYKTRFLFSFSQPHFSWSTSTTKSKAKPLFLLFNQKTRSAASVKAWDKWMCWEQNNVIRENSRCSGVKAQSPTLVTPVILKPGLTWTEWTRKHHETWRQCSSCSCTHAVWIFYCAISAWAQRDLCKTQVFLLQTHPYTDMFYHTKPVLYQSVGLCMRVFYEKYFLLAFFKTFQSMMPQCSLILE